MYSVKVLLLLSAILPSQSEMHSLFYMYSAMSRPGDKYEVYSSVELDDLQMSLCNEVNKAEFMTQLCEESERLFDESDDLRYKQQWLQINLKTLMERRKENSSRHTDLHVLQWRHGCAVERLSNGSVMLLRATDEYAYDGQTFDPSMHWTLLVLDHDIVWNRESVSSLERKCVETLTEVTDLQREGKFITESPPHVHALVKASGSSMKELLVCLATGFYPKHVQMEIRRNRTPLPDEQLNSDGIRPNADGSFQLRKSLEILRCKRSRYECVVKDQRDGTEIWKDFCTDVCNECQGASDSTISSLWIQDAVIGSFVCIVIVFPIFLLTFHPLRQCGKCKKEQDTLKTPSLLQLSVVEVHDTQSLCDTEATPAASRGAMGSKNISLPNLALEREGTDQNAITQNALLLPLPRRCTSKEISLPNLAEDRKDSSDSS